MINLKHIDEQLAKAKEDVAFWEQARTFFLDPRFAQAATPTKLPAPTPVSPSPQPYGELKRRVLAALPEWEIGGDCYSTAGIVRRMMDAGYVFASKTPAISVNEALMNLRKEGLAEVGATEKGVRFWTKAEPKGGPPSTEVTG